MVRILVVDDSPIIFKMIKKALDESGFEVVGYAENGKIGLKMIDELKPDLITLDVTMPVMGGLQMATELFNKKNNTKIIMLSSMGDEDLIQSAKKVGIEHFISNQLIKGIS